MGNFNLTACFNFWQKQVVSTKKQRHAIACLCFLSKSVPDGINPSRWMKSLRDEIRLRRDADGFNFICAADFIRALRGFHREQSERFHKKIIQGYTLIVALRSNGLTFLNQLIYNYSNKMKWGWIYVKKWRVFYPCGW